MHDVIAYLEPCDFPAMQRVKLDVLQVNLGYVCNLSCTHCHVEAGPKRKEQMTRETVDAVLDFMRREKVNKLDLTGGAPEMNPHFQYMVKAARAMQVAVTDRCNLVILQEPGNEDLAAFLWQHQVNIVASLPCYLEGNVDRQRGKGTFNASIAALTKLNALGYGHPQSAAELNLVFNPQGATLPPEQSALESAYKSHLWHEYGIVFNRLYAMANLPIRRFGSMLISKGLLTDYIHLLKSSHSTTNLGHVMCRNTLSVDWQGYVYDCDFNQMLKLPLGALPDKNTHISELDANGLQGQPITVKQHCYGCTAGQGSSCGGALI